MIGQRQVDQAALFYEFSPERHVPAALARSPIALSICSHLSHSIAALLQSMPA